MCLRIMKQQWLGSPPWSRFDYALPSDCATIGLRVLHSRTLDLLRNKAVPVSRYCHTHRYPTHPPGCSDSVEFLDSLHRRLLACCTQAQNTPSPSPNPAWCNIHLLIGSLTGIRPSTETIEWRLEGPDLTWPQLRATGACPGPAQYS